MRRSISILLLVVALQPAAVFAEKKKKRFWMNMQTGTVTAEDADPRSVMLHTAALSDPITRYNFVGQATVIFVGEIVKVTFDKKRNVQVVRFKPKKIWRGPKKELLELEAGPPEDWCAMGLRAGMKLSVIGIGSPPYLNCGLSTGADGVFTNQYVFDEHDTSKQAVVDIVKPGHVATEENYRATEAAIEKRRAELWAERVAMRKREAESAGAPNSGALKKE